MPADSPETPLVTAHAADAREALTATPPMTAPVAPRRPAPTTLHGQTLEDDYAWMREKTSAEVLDYLRAENAYTAANMRPTEGLQAELYREMLSHIKETDESVPYPNHGWSYWSSTVEGRQYPIHWRRKIDSGTHEPQPTHGDAGAEAHDLRPMLDVNQLAEGHAYMGVDAMSVSPDGRLLAYATDNTGFRQYTLHLRDLTTGEDLAESAERVGSIAWAADSATLFFTTEDEQTKRHDKLFRAVVGRLAEAELIFEETDERFNLGVGRTRDRSYILVESGSHTTSEVRFLPASEPLAPLRLMAPRIEEQEYFVDHREGLFYIRTNDRTRNFRLATTRVETPGREHWRDLYEADTPLEDFDLFRDFLVLSERRAGLPTLTVARIVEQAEKDPGTPTLGELSAIEFPDPAYSAGSSVNAEFDTKVFRYAYTSLVAPASVFEYDVETGQSTLLKEQEVPGGFEKACYASERVWVQTNDGAMVPVSLVYRRDRFHADGKNPLYVYGYGSYGFSLPLAFSATRLALLDRGLVLAYAHIRGGGELGDAWHDAGKMMLKQNTFTDFISVMEHLVQEGYGARDRVAIEGGSAGGLLMGAVVNLRPELVRAVVSHVPFVDVMNTMLDASLPLTVGEYEEWGNPNEPEAFAYMRSYSPYDNLKPGNYPAMLVKTSLNDSQVMYWEPAKYVAKLRTLKQNDTPLLLHINMEAGHGGASGRYDYLKEIAFDFAFLLRELGVST